MDDPCSSRRENLTQPENHKSTPASVPPLPTASCVTADQLLAAKDLRDFFISNDDDVSGEWRARVDAWQEVLVAPAELATGETTEVPTFGVLEMSLAEVCEYIDNHTSLRTADILSTECYAQSVGLVCHRFVVVELKRVGWKKVWLRLDRRRGRGASLVDLLLASGETEAYDRARISARLELLVDGARQENRQVFPDPPPLEELVRLLRIVVDELLVYRVWPENCWFFCSLVQQHLKGSDNGWFVNGNANHEHLADSVRTRILRRVRPAGRGCIFVSNGHIRADNDDIDDMALPLSAGYYAANQASDGPSWPSTAGADGMLSAISSRSPSVEPRDEIRLEPLNRTASSSSTLANASGSPLAMPTVMALLDSVFDRESHTEVSSQESSSTLEPVPRDRTLRSRRRLGCLTCKLQNKKCSDKSQETSTGATCKECAKLRIECSPYQRWPKFLLTGERRQWLRAIIKIWTKPPSGEAFHGRIYAGRKASFLALDDSVEGIGRCVVLSRDEVTEAVRSYGYSKGVPARLKGTAPFGLVTIDLPA